MARWVEPAPEKEAAYRVWLASRPPAVRAVAERFEPWSVYRLRTSGHRVTIVSFVESVDGSVSLKVRVDAAFNRVIFAREVFGIPPDDLEPCELPPAEELVGARAERRTRSTSISTRCARCGFASRAIRSSCSPRPTGRS